MAYHFHSAVVLTTSHNYGESASPTEDAMCGTIAVSQGSSDARVPTTVV